ncbi:MAG: hypothetical protein PHD17_12085 [Methanothrix soehngenii]|jgi:hypothetical protein|uniref:hypothetical protein n=1 Tax=Methanothrix soehngenii TaxID=2223 RepID=UPI0023F3713C|nr:hypothetical protein [Methanothrix soehngenii]MDD3975407.1 hypothetical protein [Methanothrix soehngenii]MDD5258232.1 hypothetical protein [Methanothrix soehngenii]
MAASSLLSVVCIWGRKEILSKEEEREWAKEMIRASIHQTAIEPTLKKIVIKKKKRWWQFWR